jgi:hypothetical protein
VYNIKEERFTEEFTDTSLVRWGQDGWGGAGRAINARFLDSWYSF